MSKKQYKKKRKIATYALTSAMVLANLGLVSQASAATYKPGDLASKVQQIKALEQQKLGAKQILNKQSSQLPSARANLKATDKVRVIVEVDGQTPVEYATQQGTLYKNLSESKKASIEAKIASQQQTVQNKLSAKGIKISYKQHFATAFNGFSGEITYGDLSKIESTPGVKNVYLANEYLRPTEPASSSTDGFIGNSHQFIQSDETWKDLGYKGEGMVISIIDSGVDPSHRDFKITDTSKEDLTQSKVSSLVQADNLPGKFYTDKVPYGYNYADGNDQILDIGPAAIMHGMHVAGIAAANGDPAKGGIKGVAPEAQVLAMKVFSNDPNYRSTWSDIYLKAIDDSIKLGADVLNMSLGDVAGFYEANSAEDLAISRAVDNGIVCAVAAGNADNIGYGYENPLSQNPDIGVVGAPGVEKDTIAVAAAGNESYLYQHSISVDSDPTFSAIGKGVDDWTQLAADNGGSLPIVSLGKDSTGAYKLGKPEDYNGVDVKGKIVLVARGSLTFADKTKYAAQAGAAGIIVWNANNGVQYDNQGNWDIPFMLLNNKVDGDALNAAIEAAGGQATLHVQQTSKTDSPDMGRMTDFTSWGTTQSLELKPEITAPGGNIYSTVNNNQYEVMSGTSMATPQVAGGSALVQEYLQHDQRFSSLSVSERTRLAKVLLMNTAKVITDVDGHPFSPRRQGAGMMQIENAITTPVYFVNKATGEAKVELKDFQSKQFAMTFTAKNISDKNVTYKVQANALTDEFKQAASGPDQNALQTGDLEGAKIDAPETVTVPAGQSVDFTVNVDLTNAKIPGFDANGNKILKDLTPNIFVEGQVNLIGSDGTPNLTAPYVGFYGKWDQPQIVDGFKDLGETNYFDLTNPIFGLGTDAHEMLTDINNEDFNFLGAVPEKNVYPVSPNGDGTDDYINPLPSFLRDAAEVQFNILDKNGNLLRRVKDEGDEYKNAYNAGLGSPLSFSSDRAWDGKVNGQVVPDGLYYYEIKSVIDYAGAQWQSKKIPVYVDTKAPKVAATYDPEKKVVTWNGSDDGTGIANYAVFVDGALKALLDNSTTSFDLSSYPDKSIVEVVALDYAGNASEDTAAIGDVALPTIYITDGTKDASGNYVANSPENYQAYNSKSVDVKGFVTDDIGIKDIKVNGQEVAVGDPDANGHYNYSATVNFDQDGPHDVVVEATDFANKKFSIARKIFVDTAAPVITTDAPERVDKNVDHVTFNVNLKDNFNFLEFYANDNHELEVPFKSPLDYLNPLNKDYQVTVPLQEGENKVVLRAIDLAGNETVKEVVINRADEVKIGWVKDNGVTYYYDENGSKHTGWLTLGDMEQDGFVTKYYLDPKTGAMHTGWLVLNGDRYYFDESGVMASGAAYVPENKNYFLFNDNGVEQSGIQDYYGERAYFDAEKGLLRSNWKQMKDGTWIYADKDGTLHTGWLNVAGKWYYFDQDGKMQTGWINDGKESYYLTDSGAMATGWVNISNNRYYFNQSGAKVTGWVKDGRSWYYLDTKGVMKTGWVLDGGKWYYLDQTGVMKTGWVLVSGKWYYLDNTGAMKTGWLKDSGKWYYLNNNGDMVSNGWKLINGKWYYFYKNGSMAVNTTIGKYKVGKDGARIN